MALGERLRSRRNARGLSQEEVARRTGIGLKAYGDLERGRTLDPHYSTLEGLAHALGTTVAELVGEEESVVAAPLGDALPSPAGPVKHLRQPHDSVGVSDAVKVRLEEQFNAIIADLEAHRLSKEAANVARVRDDVLAAVR